MSALTKQMVRHSTLIKAGAIALVGVTMLLAGIIPLISRTSELSKQIESRQKEEVEITGRVAVLSGLDREVLKKRVETLDYALPPRKDVLLYLSAIDGLSRELGLTFSGISLSPGEVTEASPGATPEKTKIADTVPGVHTLETEIKITGNQDNLYSFLRLVEQSLPLMQVRDVKVTKTGEANYILALRLGMLWANGDLTTVKGAITLFNDREEKYFQQLSSYRRFNSVIAETDGVTAGKSDLFSPMEINLIESPQATATPQL